MGMNSKHTLEEYKKRKVVPTRLQYEDQYKYVSKIMKKCNILIPYGGRSNEALTKPMIERLKEEDWCQLYTEKIDYITTINFNDVYEQFDYVINRIGKLDLVYIPGDRKEMFAIACAAYHNNLKVCHYGGGIIEGFSTHDEVHRHSISMMADIELCEDFKSGQNILQLWRLYKISSEEFTKIIDNSCGKSHIIYANDVLDLFNIHVVGNMYLEGLEDVDESLVPQEPYDLVLINYEPKTSKEENYKNLERAAHKTIEDCVIYINSNPDGHFGDFIGREGIEYYKDLSRDKFLGLLKNCQRYITNSSSAYYEAPYFLKPDQIIMIGERNKNRSTPKVWDQDYKTSDKICEIIKQWWFDKEHRRKEEVKND